MSGSNGHACPECGAPRQPNGTPSCGCTRRASDALRDARTAQAAAAEDFDPLRIRPYVELGGAAAGAKPAGPSDETVPMVAVPAEAGASGAGLFPEGDVPDGDFPVGDFPEGAAEPGYGSSGPGAPVPPARDEPPLRRRRTVLLASGVFSPPWWPPRGWPGVSSPTTLRSATGHCRTTSGRACRRRRPPRRPCRRPGASRRRGRRREREPFAEREFVAVGFGVEQGTVAVRAGHAERNADDRAGHRLGTADLGQRPGPAGLPGPATR